jgi:CheY-like chemotaxis protein
MKRMPNPAYFRCHAETCMRLSRTATDATAAAELAGMAEDLLATAAQLEDSNPSVSGCDHDTPRGDNSFGFAAPKRQKIVAVVDDDPDMLSAIESLLELRDVAAKIFASAEEFLNLGHASEFDCILLDIHLGGMSGFELRRQLKVSRPTLPVIFMTGSNDQAVREQALKAECAAYLRKPFLAQMLMDALEKATLKKD